MGFVGKAQIVNIPDANFKARLLASATNQIASTQTPDVTGSVTIYNNIDTNNDGEIQVSEALAIKWLSLAASSITDLTGIESFSNLVILRCNNNQINSLNVSGFNSLKRLYCNNNLISSLTISNLPQLYILYCSDNQLPSLDLTGCNTLAALICNNNQLSQIEFGGINAIKQLNCSNNQLSTLDFSGFSLMVTLYCNDNQLTSLNVNGLFNLQELKCQNNQLILIDTSTLNSMFLLMCQSNYLTKLDVSRNILLDYLSCGSNQLTSISIKNGRPLTTFTFSNNPTLHYICCDDSRITNVLAQAFQNGYGFTGVEVNSYCTFSPGGTLYYVEGNTKLDITNNGCDQSDIVCPNMKFNITYNSSTYSIIANSSGNYTFPLLSGSYNITPSLENSNYFVVSPNTTTITFPTNTSPYTQDFCVTQNGIHQDLEVVLLPLNVPRPGFLANYKLIYKNKGTTTVDGFVKVNYNANPNVMVLSSSNPPVSNVVVPELQWDYTNLQPFEARTIYFSMLLNAPTQVPPLNAGDDLGLAAVIFPILGDEYYPDNHSQIKQKVANSHDPNDKTCIEGDIVGTEMIDNYVHYIVRFENTGTYPAENIVVKDIIDTAKFDINTLIPISGSHSFETKISNTNKVEFIFENINLPFDDDNNDGYVAFKIKTKPTLTVGSTFSNSASIYFDYNFPIITNTATTTITALESQDFDFGTYFSVYPNPAKQVLNLETKAEIGVKSINIYNILGQMVIAIPNAESVSSIDVSDLKTGTYFIKVITDKGTANAKFIKE